MFIKQIIIRGFKSYRDQTVIEPFDKGHNVVVGRNGSGKSNFFCAIQFVLGDDYTHLSIEQRQALLYEGAGEKILNAFVEIIFDNTDRRVSMNEDEIHLKRIIGFKSDQYYLNKKCIPRKEFVNLFESAGFTHSNPFYIVKQGQINQIATAPDSKRLDLIKVVAGIRMYDERLQEYNGSRVVIETKFQQIEELLICMSDRLASADKEREEFKQFECQDKNRRALEYVIQELQVKDNKHKLEDLEKQRNQYSSDQKKFTSDLTEAEQQVKTFTKKVHATTTKLSSLKVENESLNNRHQHLLKERAKLDLAIKDLGGDVQTDEKSMKKAQNELVIVEDKIKIDETNLEEIKSKYEEEKKQEREYSSELSMKEQKRKDLYAKLGRSEQFSTKTERDEWIKNELRNMKKQLDDKCNYRDKLLIDLSRDAAKEVDLKRKIEASSKELELQRTIIDENERAYDEFKKLKDEMPTTNELQRNENSICEKKILLANNLRSANLSLRCSSIGKPILNGCESLRAALKTITQREGKDGEVASSYYGLVIDIFKCETSLYTAIEITAGKRLFYHIVKTEHTASLILKEINQQKLPGELNFIALNRVSVSEKDYPKSTDAIPIISKLQYDAEMFDKAIRFVFGKTLLCRNLKVATQLAKQVGLNCITLEGDHVQSSGILSGGYYNKSHSKMEIHTAKTDLNREIQECENQLKLIIEDRQSAEANVNNIVSDMQTCQTKMCNAKSTFNKLEAEIRLLNQETINNKEFQTKKEDALNKCKSNLASMQSSREALQSELKQELLSQLSAEEQAEVEMLTSDIKQLQRKTKSAFSARIKLEEDKNKVDNKLTNLIRQRNTILEVLKEISSEGRKRRLKNCRTELSKLEEEIDNVNNDMTSVDINIKDVSNNLKMECKDLENFKNNAQKVQIEADEQAQHLEKVVKKCCLIEQKLKELQENVAQLGVLPSTNIYDFYTKMPIEKLFTEMKKTNKQLKKYSHVNQKAMNNFLMLSAEVESLTKEWEELKRGNEKIEGVLAVLEQRKMSAIEFTFNTISKNFTEVFQKLVPTGRGKLLMKTVDNEDGREIRADDTNADIFTGIIIKVSFLNSNASDMKEMKQLSGGQKSLVALALIFAIQKCDSAPFYLFDEIDQALDPEYRRSLAVMIHELSKRVQFITTTFRPELLQNAHKYYGITFRNKLSHVECITREVAEDFVTDDRIY